MSEKPVVSMQAGITMDDVFAQLGRTSVQLEAANRNLMQANGVIAQLQKENATLKLQVPKEPEETQEKLDAIPINKKASA